MGSHADANEIEDRARADASTAPLVFFFFCCAIVWLLVASAAGLVGSLKLHEPDWLVQQAWLTFGRIRTIHLNAVAYGWAPMAGLGIAMFVLPRLLKTPLIGARFAFAGAVLWNAALIAGLGSIASGINDGLEWLEIPWQIGILFALGGGLIGMPLVFTLVNRRVDHHLIGGPVPEWMITLSIVQSMMMIVPVAAFTVNQYQTLQGRLSALRYSPTLRFIGVGGLMYTVSSVQGSLEALRSVNAVTHFTHYTVGHAHLGLYGFVSFVFFGAMYFVMPRITGREWPYPRLIAAHFWLAGAGIALYFASLTIGGWLQGEAMLDAARPFMESVAVTLPWLKARSVGGALMVASHLVFAGHFVALALGWGPQRDHPALLRGLFRKEAIQ